MSLKEIKKRMIEAFRKFISDIENRSIEELDTFIYKELEKSSVWEQVCQMMATPRGKITLRELQQEAEEEIYEGKNGDEIKEKVESFVEDEKRRILTGLEGDYEEIRIYRDELLDIFEESDVKPTEVVKSMDYSLDRQERIADIRERLRQIEF